MRAWALLAATLMIGAPAFTQVSFAQVPQTAATAPWVPDQGDGTYRNPVLAADYSDPDVTRVGDDFYLTSSSFANIPGLPVLTSKDLVNWTLIGHALTANVPEAHYRTPRRGGGVWAPAIRHHAGLFQIYYPDPDRGVFRVTAKDPRGPWSAPRLVDASKGVIDPAPFWDGDGKGWLVMGWAKSRAGINNRITLKPLNADGSKTVGDGVVIIDADKLPPAATSRGPMAWETLEGPKLYKRDGWYYVFAPAGGVKPGWQGVFRARRIDGPYEARNVLDQGGSATNGPHQGAWVTTASGEDWFLHFQDADAYGRRVHLQPMTWKNGWPVIGVDPDGDGIGEPVASFKKPKTAKPAAIAWPTTDDAFAGTLALAWQWNANPAGDWLDLKARPGFLRLKSVSGSANLYETGNLLSQKLPADRFTVTTKLELKALRVGEQAGLALFGYDYGWIGLRNTAQGVKLVRVDRPKASDGGAETLAASVDAPSGPVWLRMSVEPALVPIDNPPEQRQWPSMRRAQLARATFAYSLDGQSFTQAGNALVARQGRWVGAQFGLFAQAPDGTPSSIATTVGHADFDFVSVTR
jgi:beta-xylosidase